MKLKRILMVVLTFVLALSIIGVVDINANAETVVGKVDNLTCNPGEDASTTLRFNWNSSESKTVFYYTVESDTEFKYATYVVVDGVYDDTTFHNYSGDTRTDVAFYNFNCEITDLTPGTTYLYQVKCGNYYSPVHNATTASLDGSFSFIWVSDSHIHIGGDGYLENRRRWENNLITKCNELCGGANLIISSGDDTSYGCYYGDWLQWSDSFARTNFIYAASPGNHDYYNRDTGSSRMYGDKGTPGELTGYRPIYWETQYNMPENGIGDYESVYYFLYNNVLFISLDSILQAEEHRNKEMEAWFRQVMEKMEGKYQYIVVYQHFPFFDGEEADPAKYGACGYEEWHPIFDEYGVDLVLSGDSHVYLRSYRLKNNQIDNSGTTYVNAPQVGDRYRYIVRQHPDSAGLIAKRIDSYGVYDPELHLLNNSGVTYFTVTPSGIEATLIDTSYAVKDSYSMSPKRELPSYLSNKLVAEEDSLIKSATFIKNGDKSGNEYVYLDNSRVSFTSSITATLDGQTFTCVDNKICLGNLQDNKAYQVTITYNFLNGDVKTYVLNGHTYGNIGSINFLNATKENGKLKLEWQANLVGDTVASYKVYQGNTLIGTADATATSCVCNADAVIFETYKLCACDADGNILYSTSAMYKVVGDADSDGLVTSSDQDFLADYLFNNLEGISKQINDLNGDGLITYMDIMVMNTYLSGQVETLNNDQVKVIFRDIHGNPLKTQKVNIGGSAFLPTAPEVEGYTFVSWVGSYTGVTEESNVYAVYKAN